MIKRQPAMEISIWTRKGVVPMLLEIPMKFFSLKCPTPKLPKLMLSINLIVYVI